MISPKPRNKDQRKIDYKNYDAITMRRNYDTKLSGEIIPGNYELVYYVAENVGIIGILAYPKIIFCTRTYIHIYRREFTIKPTINYLYLLI